MNFEASIEKLVEITESIESPQTPLEEALRLYKEGISITKQCAETLSVYESEVFLLQKETDGLFTLNPNWNN
jgi:exodeoxyribonuclease VII small subunit